MRKLIVSAALALGLAAFSTQSFAAGAAPKPPKQDWTFNGIFGHFDDKQLQRGFQIYREICAGCHSLRLVAYRNLMEIGLDEATVKEIAAEYEIPAGPNEEGETVDEDGEPLMRPAILADKFVPPFANENAARAANAGALPPDLTLLTRARFNGPDYMYALLTGYKDEAPDGSELPEGMYYNEYFPGHQIAMAQPLDEEAVEYEDGTPMTLDQHARDITTFLVWTAQPELEERKAMGVKVVLFLIVFTAMLFALKKQIWRNVH